jgi:cytochrome c oxidase assembly factor CtaG
VASIVVNPELTGNVPLLAVAIAGAMYWWGGRRQRRWARRRRGQTLAFVAALATVVLALGEPMDGLADELFWAHMLEHVLLVVVVAPLLVVAAPWMRLWRAFPLGFRRPVARALAHGRWALPVRALVHMLGRPWIAFLAVNLDLLAWHVPGAYDLTLASEPVHDLEHLTFVAFSVLAWGQVADSRPFRSRLDDPRRIAFAWGCMVVSWVLAMSLAFSSKPWYSAYADLRHRPGGLTALADQQLGAGIMWVVASLPWSLAIVLLIYRWIGRSGASEPPATAVGARAVSPPPPTPARSPDLVT